jgi:hypothetical protein
MAKRRTDAAKSGKKAEHWAKVMKIGKKAAQRAEDLLSGKTRCGQIEGTIIMEVEAVFQDGYQATVSLTSRGKYNEADSDLPCIWATLMCPKGRELVITQHFGTLTQTYEWYHGDDGYTLSIMKEK